MTRFTLFIFTVLFLVSCKNKKTVDKSITASAKREVVTHTDTLQFISFDGNADYWVSTFLNGKKDTIALVTDSELSDKFRGKLFVVTWFADTLYEAGDDELKYAAKRLSHLKLIKGSPFVAAISEEQIIQDIKNIPEVLANADQVGIAERPSGEKKYYLVETGTRGEDNYSRFLMFRVYTDPRYEIKVYDPESDTDLSLTEWRKLKN